MRENGSPVGARGRGGREEKAMSIVLTLYAAGVERVNSTYEVREQGGEPSRRRRSDGGWAKEIPEPGRLTGH